MKTARELVLESLQTWHNLADPPLVPDRSDESWIALSSRDRPFAFDLLTGVIRWRLTLDAIIATRLRQPVDSLDLPVRAILWLGAYQLLFQQGTTDYAAVDSAVDLAKKTPATARTAGLINAVLRNITRLRPQTERYTGPTFLSRRALALDFESQVTFNTDLFANPNVALDDHLAAVRSHPLPYVKHLRALYPKEAPALLLRNNLRPVITLRADADTLDAPASAGLIAHADSPRFVVAASGWNPDLERLVAKGFLSPQDPTAAKPARLLADLVSSDPATRPLARILDLCAGLGTKALQLARIFPTAHITASDSAPLKLSRFAARAQQVAQKNITTRIPAQLEEERSLALFDAVLVDVPCSNTGVMAKRVQSRWRWPHLDHSALRALQLQLLTQGASLTADGGTLLYSTCSIDPAENAAIIDQFQKSSPRPLQKIREELTLPSLTNSPQHTHDGGYCCLLRITK